MTKNIATTAEQSRRLIACGVDVQSADMVLLATKGGESHLSINWGCNTVIREVGDIPAWSLSSLLALIPRAVDEKDGGDTYYFSLAKEYPLTDEYGASYIPCWFHGEGLVNRRDADPIEACVQMIEWLTTNEYKLNRI